MNSNSSNLPLIAPDGDVSIPFSDLRLLAENRQLMATQLEETLPKLQAAFSAKDWSVLDKLVFSLYGAILYCGLPKLSQCLAGMVKLLQKNQPASAELFKSLEQDITLTLNLLKKKIMLFNS